MVTAEAEDRIMVGALIQQFTKQNHFATIILLSPITKLAYKKQQQLHLFGLNFNPRPNLPSC
jgi:hypothetical protein